KRSGAGTPEQWALFGKRSTPFTPLFRFTFLQQEVLAFLGFRCQWRTWRRGEGDAATDKLVKGAGFHYAARQTKVQTVTRCQPEDGIVTHQVLIAFTDAHRNHHAI